LADPAGHKRIDVDLARSGADDARLRDVERTRVNTATHHDATTLYLLQPVPGLGTIRSLVRLDAIHQIDRCPRVQACAASGRLVTCATASAGTRSGTSGTNIDKAHRTGAFSAAAVFCVRDHPAGQTVLARVAPNQRQGTALTIVAPQWARAVSDMVKPTTAVARQQCLTGSGRGVGELDASRDDQGMTLTRDARHETHDGGTERRCA
jgi:hypothetical protein